ncbi:MAG TPA: hypothetical protein VII06_25750 [Chloroflexota bacterium]
MGTDWPPEIPGYVTLTTQAVRESDEYPCFPALRALLRERGVNLATSLVPHFLDEGSGDFYGVVVTAERRVLEFWLSESDGQWALTRWVDRTDDPANAADHDIRYALWRISQGAYETPPRSN